MPWRWDNMPSSPQGGSVHTECQNRIQNFGHFGFTTFYTILNAQELKLSEIKEQLRVWKLRIFKPIDEQQWSVTIG